MASGYGISYNEFWHETDLARMVLEMICESEKLHKQALDRDMNAWQIGMYVASALRSTPLSVYGQTETRDMKKVIEPYPQEPSMYKHEMKKNIKVDEKKQEIVNKMDKPTKNQMREYQKLMESIRKE